MPVAVTSDSEVVAAPDAVAPKKAARKRSASKPAGPPPEVTADSPSETPAASGETNPVLTSEGQAP